MQATAEKHWRLKADPDGVTWLLMDKAGASANSLSRDVMAELDATLAQIERAPPRALIVASAKRGFIAGADIKEFVGIQTPDQAYSLIRQGQLVLDRLAALPCVTVAAINGFALGGGLEVTRKWAWIKNGGIKASPVWATMLDAFSHHQTPPTPSNS